MSATLSSSTALLHQCHRSLLANLNVTMRLGYHEHQSGMHPLSGNSGCTDVERSLRGELNKFILGFAPHDVDSNLLAVGHYE